MTCDLMTRASGYVGRSELSGKALAAPIKALYWSAVINGVLAPPLMVLTMLLVRRKKVMGELQVEGWLYWLGWLATIVMGLSVVGMAFSLTVEPGMIGKFGYLATASICSLDFLIYSRGRC